MRQFTKELIKENLLFGGTLLLLITALHIMITSAYKLAGWSGIAVIFVIFIISSFIGKFLPCCGCGLK